MKKVGQAGTLPGTGAFTMAVFHASQVPPGTDIYIMTPSDEQPDPENGEPTPEHGEAE